MKSSLYSTLRYLCLTKINKSADFTNSFCNHFGKRHALFKCKTITYPPFYGCFVAAIHQGYEILTFLFFLSLNYSPAVFAYKI